MNLKKLFNTLSTTVPQMYRDMRIMDNQFGAPDPSILRRLSNNLIESSDIIAQPSFKPSAFKMAFNKNTPLHNDSMFRIAADSSLNNLKKPYWLPSGLLDD
jgi:hypothetical protein